MRLALPVIGLGLCLLAAGQEKWEICHNGNDIIIADPAVMQAHLDHGDCLGVCHDCERACCLPGGELLVGITQADCVVVGGRWQWSMTAPCFAGGD